MENQNYIWINKGFEVGLQIGFEFGFMFIEKSGKQNIFDSFENQNIFEAFFNFRSKYEATFAMKTILNKPVARNQGKVSFC